MKKKSLKNTILSVTLAGVIILGGTASEAALGDRVLYQGVTSTDVRELQQELRELNFFTFRTNTNYYGRITADAVRKFQRANGLVVDGAFGPASYRALRGQAASSKPAAKPAPSRSSSGRLTYRRYLANGSRGNDVRDLQNALKKLGHHTGVVDGIFGRGTRASVISFQRAQRIAVDGIAGVGTFSTINNVLDGKTAAAKPSAPNRGSSSSSTATNVVNTAKKYIGSRYTYGGTSPSGFDCSGFTQYVYRQMGVSIPRTTTTQANAGTRVSKSQLQPGDLVIFSNTYRNGPSHAGVYIGSGQFVHASSSSRGVRIDNINSNYYRSKFSYGRRVF